MKVNPRSEPGWSRVRVRVRVKKSKKSKINFLKKCWKFSYPSQILSHYYDRESSFLHRKAYAIFSTLPFFLFSPLPGTILRMIENHIKISFSLWSAVLKRSDNLETANPSLQCLLSVQCIWSFTDFEGMPLFSLIFTPRPPHTAHYGFHSWNVLKPLFNPKINKVLFPAHRVTKIKSDSGGGKNILWKMCIRREFVNLCLRVTIGLIITSKHEIYVR